MNKDAWDLADEYLRLVEEEVSLMNRLTEINSTKKALEEDIQRLLDAHGPLLHKGQVIEKVNGHVVVFVPKDTIGIEKKKEEKA